MADEIRHIDEDGQLRHPAIARAVAYARAPVPVSDDLEDRILAAVRGARPEPGRATPRRHLALAAGIGALMLGSAWIGRQTAPDVRAAASTPAVPDFADGSAVQFVVRAPGASTVTLVGDFNEWHVGATPLEAAGQDGVWTVTIPLPAGRHEYAFVVDGARWLSDPNAPRAGSADFGAANSVITVTDRT